MNEVLTKKQSKIEETLSFLGSLSELSCKVLDEARTKKEFYFGQNDTKEEGQSGVLGIDNGTFNKIQLEISFIRQRLVEISDIINLF